MADLRKLHLDIQLPLHKVYLQKKDVKYRTDPSLEPFLVFRIHALERVTVIFYNERLPFRESFFIHLNVSVSQRI